MAPGAEDIAAVRFAIGDIDAAAPLLTDKQIGTVLEEVEGDREWASVACLESLSRRYALQADISTGDTKLTYSKQAENLAERARELRARVVASRGGPFAGGISVSDKEAREENSDRVGGVFRRGQFDDHRDF
jgi:hypothetical protein